MKITQRQTQKCLQVNKKILEDHVQGFDLIKRKQLITEYISRKYFGKYRHPFSFKKLQFRLLK